MATNYKLQRPLVGDMSQALLTSKDGTCLEFVPMDTVAHLFEGGELKRYFNGGIEIDGTLRVDEFTEAEYW